MNSPQQNPTLKTRQQIAWEYGISRSTLRRWLIDAGIRPPRRLLSRRWQKCIYKRYGFPGGTSPEDFETVADILVNETI